MSWTVRYNASLVWEDEATDTFRSRDEWERDLLKARDELYEWLAFLRARRPIQGRLTEQDVIEANEAVVESTTWIIVASILVTDMKPSAGPREFIGDTRSLT